MSDLDRLLEQTKAHPVLWAVVTSGIGEEALKTYPLHWLLDHIAICRSLMEETGLADEHEEAAIALH